MKDNLKKLANPAFEIFRKWSKIVSQQNPGIDLTIIDETKLVNDLHETILMAIESFKNLDETIKNKYKRHEYHFFISFIKGNLNTRWTHEYINRNSNEYRNFIVCKSILEFIKLEPENGQKINEFYKIQIEENTNLENLNTNIEHIDFSKYNIDLIDLENNYPNKETPIYSYLENQLKTHLANLMEMSKNSYMPQIYECISKDLLFEFLKQYGIIE